MSRTTNSRCQRRSGFVILSSDRLFKPGAVLLPRAGAEIKGPPSGFQPAGDMPEFRLLLIDLTTGLQPKSPTPNLVQKGSLTRTPTRQNLADEIEPMLAQYETLQYDAESQGE